MATFDVLVIVSGMCGVFMIVGSMLLLYRGIISLDRASKESAVDVELKNMIKITTHYPSLGLFIIGLIFIIGAMWIAKSNQPPLRVSGTIRVADPSSVTIRVSSTLPSSILASGKGTIQGAIFPIVYPLRAEITAPGYDPPTQYVTVSAEDVKFGEISLGAIVFTNQVTKNAVSGIIVPVTQPLPDLSHAGAFK